MAWSQGWNGLGVMLDTYTILVGLLEKISVHSSRVFEANIAANFFFVSGCVRTQKGQPHYVWLVYQHTLVLQARPFPFHTANHFQYWYMELILKAMGTVK